MTVQQRRRLHSTLWRERVQRTRGLESHGPPNYHHQSPSGALLEYHRHCVGSSDYLGRHQSLGNTGGNRGGVPAEETARCRPRDMQGRLHHHIESDRAEPVWATDAKECDRDDLPASADAPVQMWCTDA